MRPEHRVAIGAAMVAAAALPPMSAWLEARLVLHILVQYPLLLGGGALFGAVLTRGQAAGWTAAPALLAGALALLFWLTPRWIDAALAGPWITAAKVVALAGLAGPALGWGAAQAGTVLRGFALAKAVLMLVIMGWLQLAVPSRLCNAYLMEDQRALGWGLLLGACLLGLTMLMGALGICNRTELRS